MDIEAILTNHRLSVTKISEGAELNTHWIRDAQCTHRLRCSLFASALIQVSSHNGQLSFITVNYPNPKWSEENNATRKNGCQGCPFNPQFPRR